MFQKNFKLNQEIKNGAYRFKEFVQCTELTQSKDTCSQLRKEVARLEKVIADKAEVAHMQERVKSLEAMAQKLEIRVRRWKHQVDVEHQAVMDNGNAFAEMIAYEVIRFLVTVIVCLF